MKEAERPITQINDWFSFIKFHLLAFLVVIQTARFAVVILFTNS